MPVTSAGILLYRQRAGGLLEVWIAHMGGPFWARKDAHAWSIPKGEYSPGEDPLAAALREFAEEMGTPAPAGDYRHLGGFRQPSGKIITVFAAEHDFQPERIVSNAYEMEWPPKSGRVQSFPEIDRADWFDLDRAEVKILPSQRPLLAALRARVEA